MVNDYLNIPDIPDDSGEYRDDLTDIMNRIPDGWGNMKKIFQKRNGDMLTKSHVRSILLP